MEENKKKKILYLITKANWGGAQKYVFDLASEITDYEVVVAYGRPFGELSQKLKTAGIRTLEVESLERDVSLLREAKVFRNLWKILKQEQPDILHLNSPKISGLGVFLGRLAGIKKIIYTAHGWTFNEKRPFWQVWLIKFLSWLTIILSHQTIVIAQKEYNQVIHWPLVTTKKLKLIYNGIKPIDFLEKEKAKKFFEGKILKSSRACPPWREMECNETTKRSRNDKLWTASQACLPDRQARRDKIFDGLVIGTISELHKNKGLKYAIKGFREITGNNPNAKFIIIGEGEEREYLAKTISEEIVRPNISDKKCFREKKIKKYNLENKVFLVGNVKNASQYLKAFDIFLLSSLKEGLPFALLEAGLAKLPVIATTVGGIPEIIEDNVSGILIKEKNGNNIENALTELIEDEEKRKILGENLQKIIKEKFSFEEMVEKTKKLHQFE